MSLNPELKSINCTACGAGLDVLGGGRVTTHVCAYCGSALDTLDNYQVLQKFDLLNRPESPFKIGMTGTLFGVDYTVIGMLEHEEVWGPRRWTWVDHQLFSPTHGYAWLTLEDSHLTFSRRYRKPVGWMSVTWVETAETRPKLHAGGVVYKYYETSSSSVIFAEGEFTWSPKTGEKTTAVSAMSEDAVLSFSQTGQEREIYRTVYLDWWATEQAFGLAAARAPRGVHALQPAKFGPNAQFLTKSGLLMMALCLVLGILLSAFQGSSAFGTQRFDIADLPVTVPFKVVQPRRLTRVHLKGSAHNSWGYFAVELEDPEGELLFETGRTVEYYQGRDKDGSWSEGSNHAMLGFFPPVAGTYSLSLALEEGGLWGPNSSDVHPTDRPMQQLEVSIRNGVSSGYWLYLLGLGFGVIGGLPLMRRFLHYKARWRGSDWVEEGDD
ncbi:hypothetical protein PH5382_02843 [Phaeobacter sp. CECT 5382]|uniref:DUF4178 domain-containing protein n=1 Tax=Phaeobacter sp. CECT 5382 TaxID=1712645 RepID=UPI0006DB7EE8|nr:DUF4178 domain-containing protein [Phaeobacter sp. CECT 5382]CUH88899.1 hypothetical protein PH5382_02843 [Phaeobacter sp. CECT 5382]